MATFKAVELDRRSRRPTGRQERLEGPTRQAAIDALLARLGVAAEAVRLDPSRTMLQVDDGNTWTLIAVATQARVTEAPSLRRGGAKHRTVR